MTWTDVMRRKYRRDGLHYASDATHAEWMVIELQMPPPGTAVAMCAPCLTGSAVIIAGRSKQ